MHALETNQLRKTYNNGIEAVKGIDLVVNYGDFFALLGANGAGKSTTIGLITTLLTKSSGTIQICGYDLQNSPEKAKALIGLVPQEFNLNIFESCWQILLNQAGFYGLTRKASAKRAEQLLKQLGIWDKRNSIVRHLSGGMKRRLMIARALIHNPKVLILDEPTAGVDIEIRRSMWEFLTLKNKEGITIILTTHYLEEAEQLCKKIAIIDKGVIVKNTTMRELLSTIRYQTFVFSTSSILEKAPVIAGCDLTIIDKQTLEIRIDNTQNLNTIFNQLTEHGIVIQSLRNKTNRLEELFLDLISHDQ